MKRLLSALMLMLIFALTVVGVFYFSTDYIAICEENDKNKAENEFSDAVDDNLNKLDADDFENYFQSMSDEQKDLSGAKTAKSLIKYVSKNGLTVESFRKYFNYLFKSATSGLLKMLPAFVSIMALSVLSGLLREISSDLMKKQTSGVICLVMYVAAVLTVLGCLIPLLNSVKGTVQSVKKLSEAVFPPLLLLTTALGGAVTAGVFGPMTVVFSGALVGLIDSVILPCFIATVVFSVVGNVTESVKLEKMTSFFKSFSTWLLSLSFGAFVTYVTFQGVSGAAVDSATVTASKKLVSGQVPVLGEYLSDGLDVAYASVGLLKNSVGISGAIVCLAVTLAPLLRVVVFLLLAKLTAAVSEAVGDKKISAMLSGMQKSAGLLVAALLGITFVFLIMAMLMIFCFNPGV